MQFSSLLTTSQLLQEGRMHVKKKNMILRFLQVNLLELDFFKMIFGPNVSGFQQDKKMASLFCALYIFLDNLNTEYRSELKLRKENHLFIIYGTSNSLLLLFSSLDSTMVKMTVKTIS